MWGFIIGVLSIIAAFLWGRTQAYHDTTKTYANVREDTVKAQERTSVQRAEQLNLFESREIRHEDLRMRLAELLRDKGGMGSE